MAHENGQSGKRSAELVAAFRAVGARDPAVGNPDFLADRLLSLPLRAVLLPGLRQIARARAKRIAPGMYLYHQARTKHIDELFLAQIREAEQIVVLGAGLDTRPYRFADHLAGKRVFEVDHPGTAAWKRDRLTRLGRPTDHVTYATADFTVDRLDDVLRQAGYVSGATTFFLWEGVVMYLPRDSVKATLEVIGRAAAGSSVLFDYVHRSALEKPGDYLGAKQYQEAVARRGEPVLFGVDPEEVAGLLAPYALEVVSNAGPDELSRLVPPEPLCDFFGVVLARRRDGE